MTAVFEDVIDLDRLTRYDGKIKDYIGDIFAEVPAPDMGDYYTREEVDELFVPKLVFDREAGRYTNESVAAWMDGFADGLVYGVQIPRYSYDPDVTAVKTGANAGLVLEGSTSSVEGRNDYAGKKLFMCPRVNGGADVDGTNYVTAIEGISDWFDAAENTYVLTPVYYVRRTEIEADGVVQYDHNEFSDTAKAGFEPCAGAYMKDGTERKFILRACYMDSDGQMSSKSGEIPAAYYPDHAGTMFFNHSCLDEFVVTRANEDNGLTFFTYGDMAYLIDFMQLMLGVKAPKSVASGQRAYSVSGTNKVAAESTDRIVLTAADAAKFEVGMTVAVGSKATRSNAATHEIVSHAVVTAKSARDGDDYIDLVLDVDEGFDTTTSTKVMNMSWINGCLDGIRGTYGSFSAEALVNPSDKNATHRWPFRFQNMEWMTGLSVIIQNMRNVVWTEEIEGNAMQINQICIAPDISACQLEYTEDPETGARTYTGFIHPQGKIANPNFVDSETTPNEPEQIDDPNDPEDLIGTGWIALQSGRWVAPTSSGYIKDYTVEDGAHVPVQPTDGTSTAGYMVQAYSTTGDKAEKQVSGFGNGLYTTASYAARFGVGNFLASYALGFANASALYGGRSSTIGYSAQGAE